MNCLPVPRNAQAATRSISVDPQAKSTCSGFTWWKVAIRSVTSSYFMNGYRFTRLVAERIALATLGRRTINILIAVQADKPVNLFAPG